MYDNVCVDIVEEPASGAMRFRYLSEGPSSGSLCGVHSTKEKKTSPAIRTLNYDGAAFVIVSCVTDDKIPKPHPNCLTGSEKCLRGVYRHDFYTQSSAPTVVELHKVGIQCAKREFVKTSLDDREELRIDPFRTGFGHKLTPKSIDVHRVRLCFQVFLKPDAENPNHLIPLKPVVSDVIIDKQSKKQLNIREISDVTGPSQGGKLIMLFCDKLSRDGISIKFYEENADGKIVWEERVKPKTVHKQVALSFLTPPYRVQNIDKPVNVFFRLETLAKEPTFGDFKGFQYVPDTSNIQFLHSKEHKIDDSSIQYVSTEMTAAEYCPKPVITGNILLDEATSSKYISPVNGNCGSSNLDISNNNSNLPRSLQHQQYTKPQHQQYTKPQHQQCTKPQHQQYTKPQHQQYTNAYSQHSKTAPEVQYQPYYKSDCQSRLPEQLQPLQSYNVEPENHFATPIQVPSFYQQQYQRMTQTQDGMDHNSHASRFNPYKRHAEVGIVRGDVNNLSTNNLCPSYLSTNNLSTNSLCPSNLSTNNLSTSNIPDNLNRPTQTMGHNQTMVEPTHYPCQQAAPVIYQTFTNNLFNINNPQTGGAEILSNLSDYCVSSDTSMNMF